MSERRNTPDVLAEILGEGFTAASPEPGRAHDGRWESVVVSCQDYHGWRPRYLNGEELPDWTANPPMHEYANRMGGDGWQLTAAASGARMFGKADEYQLWFRRRVR